jgi:error-prone DNA polymerase
MEPYIEFHARSAFSFLRAASLPEELAGLGAEMDMPAMALLDRDGVYGAPRFHLAAKKLGTRAHIGAEITLQDGSVLPLLVETRAGYQNLCRLITTLKLRPGKKQVLRSAQDDRNENGAQHHGVQDDPEKSGWHGKASGGASYEDLAAHSEGLIALTGDEHGPLSHALSQGYDSAKETAARLARIFGKQSVYAELQRHFHRDQEGRNQAVLEIARRLGIPLLATNGVCHARPGQRHILDVFTCIRNKVRLSTAGRLLARNAERHLKTGAEMARLFADVPAAIANTAELSSRLQFTLADLGYRFPEYPAPPGETMNSFLRQRAWAGARERYGDLTEGSPARKQIERELALIERLQLAGYFLTVWDIIQFCRAHNILVQGRGSAANSAVCYSLGITAVDPIKMELLFERFLSEERGEWPDIDLDLPSGTQRERAIQYVYKRYGQRGAAMTANVITYRGRSASREIGKVLGFEEATVSRLAGLVRAWEWKDPQDTPQRQFEDAGLDVRDPLIRQFFELYLAVQDLPRHLGQHSGGMVMCQGPLDAVVPLEPASMPGRVVVQWDKDDCADMGMIKIDLLGLGMMAALEDSLAIIRESYGEEVDLAHLPADDPDVYAALQTADTVGLFQVESRAQMASLPRLHPVKFYDLVVQVGIIRPGPIVGNMVHPYIRRRQGKEPPDCFHPSLEPVLRRTLGVPLFQEQLLRVAMIASGFSGGEAEELRRAFSHKRSEARMREIEVRLRRGMERNGITGKPQNDIVQSITSFALYGFPESHAASFALLAYASAYLKCHYLAAFTAALLNNQPMGFYYPATIIKDAQRHGLKIQPLDVTRSEWRCTVERDSGRTPPEFSLRMGLRYAKGLREEPAQALLRERARRPFRDIEDLTRRVPELRKDEMVRLAEIGALNWVGNWVDLGGAAPTAREQRRHRRKALWQAESATRPAGPLLHNAAWDGAAPDGEPCPLLPMNYPERLQADFRGTGLTLGKHPMQLRRAEMDSCGVSRAADLRDMPGGRFVRVAGNVIVRQRPGTAKGFVFLSIEDETGIANAIVTPDLFDRYRAPLVNEPFLMIEGILQNVDHVASVKVTRVQPLTVGSATPAAHDFH